MPTVASLPAPTEVGALGVCQLKRMWAAHAASVTGPPIPRREEWALDHVILCGLNLALEETLGYLANARPDFAKFEAWVLARNDGRLDPRQVARINAAVVGERQTRPVPCGEAGERRKVLGAADHAHFDEHGYVVVREAVPRREANAAADALCRAIGMDLADPESWYAPRTHGIMVQLFHHPALAAHRASRRIRSAFEELWATDDLWMTVDRISVNPPERDGWRFPGPRLHWDADFTVTPFPFATQGILYLTDTPAHQGAFACVPGFHRRIDAWLAARPAGGYPQGHELGDVEPTPIAAEAGDLVIWHHALPHAATPNHGRRPRIAHYVNMLPTPAVRHGRADFAPQSFG